MARAVVQVLFGAWHQDGPANVVEHMVPHCGNRIRKKRVGVGRKGLTPREQEVALLAQRKLTNGEIARKLDIKRGTVKVHVHNILKKGGLRRRPSRSSKGTKTATGIERIREAQRRRWQLWRAARSVDDT